MKNSKDISERKVAIVSRLMNETNEELIRHLENAILLFDAPKVSKAYTKHIEELADMEWGKTKPTKLIANEKEISVRSWRQVYIEIIKILIKTTVIRQVMLPIPDYYGNSRFFANKIAIHRSGKGFTDPELIEGIYFECHYNTQMKMRNLVRLVEKSQRFKSENFKIIFKA
ncbi:hypothetical protein [Algoriphagus sediminis]|uniref:Uncharacterized protein n=1 Tax=Algoriphagus sediminis TaxID=3057113 RepID=A0ABT7YHI5_9BACT|nr:hypothetical protein [Algoriphagus sediminis]MDN3205933.1 hypothetical protein [Algoriphagus sediminis]